MSKENEIVSAEEARGLLGLIAALDAERLEDEAGVENYGDASATWYETSPVDRCERLARTVIALHAKIAQVEAELGVVTGENLQMRAERSAHRALRRKAEAERDEARRERSRLARILADVRDQANARDPMSALTACRSIRLRIDVAADAARGEVTP